MTEEQLRAALLRSFQFGEQHWAQADSMSPKQWKKADETIARHGQHIASTIALLNADQPADAPRLQAALDHQRDIAHTLLREAERAGRIVDIAKRLVRDWNENNPSWVRSVRDLDEELKKHDE